MTPVDWWGNQSGPIRIRPGEEAPTQAHEGTHGLIGTPGTVERALADRVAARDYGGDNPIEYYLGDAQPKSTEALSYYVDERVKDIGESSELAERMRTQLAADPTAEAADAIEQMLGSARASYEDACPVPSMSPNAVPGELPGSRPGMGLVGVSRPGWNARERLGWDTA